jgi:hypothetical protein
LRDPWFPAILALIVLLAVWLGIIGPLPAGVTNWIQGWQSLIAATVASIAAYIAFSNTNRSLAHSEKLETNRRKRKLTALRATLPLALAQMNEYAYETAQSLNTLVANCDGDILPAGAVKDDFVSPLPPETLKSLTEFMEYADSVNVNVLASTVALIQIHDSRLRGILRDNRDASRSSVTLRSNLEGGIVTAATIFAGAASGFDYARRREKHLPGELELLWADVRRSLSSMGFGEEEYPRLHEIVERNCSHSAGPFSH